MRKINGFLSQLKQTLFGKTEYDQPPLPAIQPTPPPAANTSAQKKDELENLCEKLFQRQELITSGKLQMIGLSEVKKNAGKNWPGFQKIVHEAAQAAIAMHIEKGDIHIPYKDDLYVIVFASSSLEQGERKAHLIAEEIRKRLFAVDVELVKSITLVHSVSQIESRKLTHKSLPEIASTIEVTPPVKQSVDPSTINRVEVKTDPVVTPQAMESSASKPTDECSYIPMWDVGAKALTTYLCLPVPSGSNKDLLLSYQHMHGQTYSAGVRDDIKLFKLVVSELIAMQKDGRKLLIICPVQYETLYRQESYEQFRIICQTIPLEQKKFLSFLVVNSGGRSPQKDPYWFVAPLKKHCRSVMFDMPLGKEINFQALAQAGVDALGVKIDPSLTSEQEMIKRLNQFALTVRAHKSFKTFLLGISTLSFTTSAVCAGFDYLGGTAIHNDVVKPDSVHRYQYEDLISSLVP